MSFYKRGNNPALILRFLESRIQMEPWPSGERTLYCNQIAGEASRDYRLSAGFESQDT